MKKQHYAFILNFEKGRVYRMKIPSSIKEDDFEYFISRGFNLDDCSWMFTTEKEVIDYDETI